MKTVPDQGCQMAKFDPFLSLDCAWDQILQRSRAIDHQAQKAKHIQSKNLATIWQPCPSPTAPHPPPLPTFGDERHARDRAAEPGRGRRGIQRRRDVVAERGHHLQVPVSFEKKSLVRTLYRVTITLVQNLQLTSNQKFRFGLTCPALARPKRHFLF